MWKKLKIAICEPRRAMISLWMRSSKLLPDKLYLSVLFRFEMGYWINWKSPQTFSEKLQWLKLYNRKPEYTQMVDKYAVKEYVARLIGEEYIISTLGVWDRVEDIDFETLPNQFVLKTTHGGGGGGVVVCKDKASFDFEAAKAKLQQSMNSDIYHIFREWPYKDVKKRILAEQFIAASGRHDLPDYKLFCFNGDPKCCQVIAGRESITTIDWYDRAWNHLPFHEPKNYPFSEKGHDKPNCLNEMWALASKLSQGHPFLRVDFYEIKGTIKFGELTFYPTSGMGGFEPEEWDYTLGDWIKLP